MRVFLTGATGFIGSRIVPELISAGHQVLGLTRSDEGAATLARAGVEAYRGTLEDPETLARGAAEADAVIHTAFDHDFTRFLANCEKDRRVIEAIGAALSGTGKPFLVTSGVGMGSEAPGQIAIEQRFDRDNPNPRRLSELAGEAVAAKGVSVVVVRLPQVHDTEKQGLITPMIEIARARGVAAYVGEGKERWSAAHVTDVARLFRLALERHEPGARYNAVAEEGVSVRQIAETVGRGLGLPVRSLSPEEVAEHYGPLAHFATLDMPASSEWTRRTLGWEPTGPSLLSDLQHMNYSAAGTH
ncbi:nucleoside-diphosphate-sugar epimerase [Angulomicrobium tetraedrale]|uniref:Nucleoside-diphosphate-sugar epimerase n=1 Tax=Ancylobacter tetraedralis TaxID=217068 RepID=A0A839ZBV9_9HYPH|nr:SDR family oxidoreductase [Ancylobacter tetraedralis]MBB3772188.1 nucleoside-diphosphate-sugar epimerase [Ancylobacter tetraedralis]